MYLDPPKVSNFSPEKSFFGWFVFRVTNLTPDWRIQVNILDSSDPSWESFCQDLTRWTSFSFRKFRRKHHMGDESCW